MKRKRLTAAEKEARGDAGFLRGDRAARDAARKQHVADALRELRRTATISAAAAARKREIARGLTDMAERRRARKARRWSLMAEFDEAAAPLLAWFAKIEG